MKEELEQERAAREASWTYRLQRAARAETKALTRVATAPFEAVGNTVLGILK